MLLSYQNGLEKKYSVVCACNLVYCYLHTDKHRTIKMKAQQCVTALKRLCRSCCELNDFPVTPAWQKWNCGDGSPVASESFLKWQSNMILCMLWVIFTFALLIFFSPFYPQQKLMTMVMIFSLAHPSHPSVILPALIRSPGKAAESLTCSCAALLCVFQVLYVCRQCAQVNRLCSPIGDLTGGE